MTVRRTPGTFAAAWEAVRRLGESWAAERLGVDPTRLRQLSNPNRTDCAVLELAVRADALARAEGHGTPILDTYRRRLESLEGGHQPSLSSRGMALSALRAAATHLLELLDASPELEGAR